MLGKVQKVFFRANTESEANKLGLIGHVENTVEGSVKGEAIGTKENIQQLLGQTTAKRNKSNLAD